jgi:hypothetical protein
MAREAGWVAHDVYEVGSQADFRITFAKLATMLLRSMGLRQRMKKRAQAALGVVKAFAEFAPPGFRFRLEVVRTEGKADSGNPEDDLAFPSAAGSAPRRRGWRRGDGWRLGAAAPLPRPSLGNGRAV